MIVIEPSAALRIVRFTLLALSIASTLFVIYASLVPLRYTELPWDEVVAKWKHIPWFDLEIESRADWVANGLIMLPPGFFAAGAVGFRRKSPIWMWLAAPVIVIALSAVVVGIEMVQVYFPPRVVSQNDIFAGLIGSLGGVILWFLSGNWLGNRIEQFIRTRPGPQRWLFVGQASLVLLCLYNLLPLDVILSWEELHEKWQKGRMVLVPLQDIPSEIKPVLKWLLSLGVAGFRVAPFALIASLCKSPRFALWIGILAAVTIEIVKIPIYSREFSTADVVASIAGVILVTKLHRLILTPLPHLDRGSFWLAGAIGWSGVMLVAFLARFDSVVTDLEVLEERAWSILSVPFANAHNSREFEAGVNILLKLVAFGAFAFLLCGWKSRRSPSTVTNQPRNAPWAVLILAGAGMGLGIEIGQVFLLPLIPDATDWITYSFGMLLGIGSFYLLMPDQEIMRKQIQELLVQRRTQ